jgi:hypothetical protein
LQRGRAEAEGGAVQEAGLTAAKHNAAVIEDLEKAVRRMLKELDIEAAVRSVKADV